MNVRTNEEKVKIYPRFWPWVMGIWVPISKIKGALEAGAEAEAGVKLN